MVAAMNINGVEVNDRGQDVVREMQRRVTEARDFIVPSQKVTGQVFTRTWTLPNGGDTRMHCEPTIGWIDPEIPGQVTRNFPLNRTAHQQLGEKLKIPRAYYERMVDEQPLLWEASVNTWLDSQGGSLMVRTLDDHARAVLSDRYRSIPNYDVFMATFGAARDIAEQHNTGVTISGLALNDDYFEGRIVSRDTHAVTLPNGDSDSFRVGVHVKNSETGRGSLQVRYYVLRLVCTNGMVAPADLFDGTRVVHRGAQHDEGLVSAETFGLENDALMSRIRDTVGVMFDPARLADVTARMNAAAAMQIDEPVRAVADVARRFNISDEAQQSILNELAAPSWEVDPGRTVYGLIQAVTAQAHKTEDQDTATDYETIGAQLLAQPELVTVAA